MKINIHDEQEILIQIDQGKEEALLRFYNANRQRMFLYVMTILKDRDEAEDILQEVFVIVWERRKNLVQIRHMKSYLQAVSKNMALKRMLSDKKKNSHIDSFIEFVEGSNVSLDEEYEAKELSL